MRLSSIEKEEYARYFAAYDFSQFLKDKTFLITGGKGMTASAIIKWILYSNAVSGTNTKIFISTRTPDVIPDYIDLGEDSVAFVPYLNEATYIGSANIDYIVHAAAPTGREFFTSKPVETVRTIIDATEAMITLVREHNNASMIFLSSVEVYGTPVEDTPVRETYVGAINSLNIRNSYPVGKTTAEFLCYAACHEYGTDIKIVRMSAVQGLFQPYNEPRVFGELVRCLVEKKNLVLKTKGTSQKSFVYTLDAVTGIFATLFMGKSGEAYNLTNQGTYYTVVDLASMLFARFAPHLSVEFALADNAKTGYLPYLSFTQDTTKLIKLGWTPITDLFRIYEVDLKRFPNPE